MRSVDFRALRDVLTLMLVLILVKQLVLPHSLLLAGPASTLCAMIVATFLLRSRGLRWWDLGLRRPKSLINTLLLVAATFFTIAVLGSLTSSIAGNFFESVGSSGRFDFVQGDLIAYLFVLVLVWTHGSFFEELLFRAYIINRGSTFLGTGIKADAIAAVGASLFFGYRHYYYQGMKGAITTGVIGLGLSALYIWFGKKNILPLILGHGLVNTISQTQRFLGVSPD